MREGDRSNQLSGRGSRIAAAIGIGVLVGRVFVFMFPNGFLSSSNPPTDVIRPLSKSNLEDEGEMTNQKGIRKLYGRFFYRFPNGESADVELQAKICETR